MVMQVKVPKKYYQILKQALLESYHHEVCHFDDLECTIERKFPVRELLSEESNKRINKWSWGIVLEFLRRIEEKKWKMGA